MHPGLCVGMRVQVGSILHAAEQAAECSQACVMKFTESTAWSQPADVPVAYVILGMIMWLRHWNVQTHACYMRARQGFSYTAYVCTNKYGCLWARCGLS